MHDAKLKNQYLSALGTSALLVLAALPMSGDSLVYKQQYGRIAFQLS